MPSRILIGTSSLDRPDAVKEGHFYPPEAKTAESAPPLLRRRSSRSSRSTRPTTSRRARQNSVLWIERTPERLHVQHQGVLAADEPPDEARVALQGPRARSCPRARSKRRLYREQLPDEVVDEVWQRFRDALMPLHSAGKLGAVLFQFPQWFVISARPRLHRGVRRAAARLPGRRRVPPQELDGGAQRRGDALFLEERDLPFVCVDMPQGFDSSLPPVAAATADDLAMVRFHGRDPEAWDTKSETASERFRYDYRSDELQEWAPEDRGPRRAGARDPRPDEQLLPRLRGAQRPGAGRPARPRPRRRGVAVMIGGVAAAGHGSPAASPATWTSATPVNPRTSTT